MEIIADYFDEVQTLIEVRNFTRCKSYEFVCVDVKGKNDLELKAKVYPRFSEKHVSVYVTRESAVNNISTVNIKCVICVLDSDRSRHFSTSFEFRNHGRADVFIFGLEQCFSRRTLLESSDEYIPGNVLTLQLDLTYSGKVIPKAILNVARTLKGLADKFSKTKSELNEYGLLEGKLTIETMDGTQKDIYFEEGIRTLGMKLCQASSVFRKMLESPMKEKINRKVKIDDFDAFTLSTLLQFVQNGTVDWPGDLEDVYSLYEMSDKYEILNLMQECSRYLSNKLNTENVIDISKLAIMHYDWLLKKAVSTFFMAKGILLIGKTSEQTLYTLSKVVNLKLCVPKTFTNIDSIDHSNHLNKHILLIRKFEDSCILYEIADEFKMENMLQECARFMKQTITPDDVKTVLSFAQRYRYRQHLAFVEDYVFANMDQDVGIELQDTCEMLFSRDNSLSSSSSERSPSYSVADDDASDRSEFDFYR